MKNVLMGFTIAGGALLQLFLPEWSIFGGIKPPVIMACAIYYALHRTAGMMWFAIFWAALLQDGLDLGTFGPALLAFPLIGYLAQRIRLEIFADGVVTQVICGMLGAMMLMFISVLVYAINGQRSFHFGTALLRIFGSGLLGLFTLPLVSLTVNKLEAILPKRRGYGWQ